MSKKICTLVSSHLLINILQEWQDLRGRGVPGNGLAGKFEIVARRFSLQDLHGAVDAGYVDLAGRQGRRVDQARRWRRAHLEIQTKLELASVSLLSSSTIAL